MKISFQKLSIASLAVLFSVVFYSCDNETEVNLDEPFASFTSEVDAENTLTVTFTDNSLDADTYQWDFGDGSGSSTEANPSYTYTASGTYTVTLTVSNAAGIDEATAEISVSGFGPNLVLNGDMAASEGWMMRPLWTNEDNAVDHRFESETFIFQNGTDADGNRYQWSNAVLFQEISLKVGSTYQFNADVSSTSGTNATWFEVFLVKSEPVDESNIGGDAVQLAIKAFGDGENCTASPFDGTILEVAASCPAVNDFSRKIDADGMFTVSAEDLSADGTIFLVFKAGSGFAAEGETAGFREGIVLDNVVIKEAL